MRERGRANDTDLQKAQEPAGAATWLVRSRADAARENSTPRWYRAAMMEINGSPPPLADAVLEALICVELWDGGELDDAAHVIWLRVLGEWHRLYFDLGMVFWDPKQHAEPEPPGAHAPDAPFRSVDLGAKLGIQGRRFAGWKAEPDGKHGARVTLQFHGGGALTFVSDGDTATYTPEGLIQNEP